jgi:shikimate kinase
MLIGFMGAGKTTVGRLVADALERPFRDLDAEIEKRTGLSVDDIFARYGEEGFRSREREALQRMCLEEDLVVACGGGVVTDEGSRTVLRDCGDVVYLIVSSEEALARVGAEDAGRPLLRGASLEAASALLAVRERLYEASADFVVSTSGAAPEDIAARIVAWVRSRP